MESLQIIEQILNEIAEARSVPLSRDGALVNRQEMINLLAYLVTRRILQIIGALSKRIK